MNFEFSEEQEMLRDQASRFLSSASTLTQIHAALDREPSADSLWHSVAELGWPAVRIPAEYGGLGMGYLELCILAEELGRVLAPVAFGSSAFLATELLIDEAGDDIKLLWLPKIAGGSAIGCVAVHEGPGSDLPRQVRCEIRGGQLFGTKTAVMDGAAASFAIVAARLPDDGNFDFSLFLVDLNSSGVRKVAQPSLDPSRAAANFEFEGCDVLPVGAAGAGRTILWKSYERAAVLVAFEQLGGADAALKMSLDFVKERRAFGRAIGSFQAIKHKLADLYVLCELARSNCYYGAWALSAGSAELPIAAASARIAASEAFETCSAENMQLHGGMGFTWEADCHLFYRRAKMLSVFIEAPHVWKNRLIDTLQLKNAA